MKDYKERFLHIEFIDLEQINDYQLWKKKCRYLFGHGGIKSRIVELIRDDLKKLTAKMN